MVALRLVGAGECRELTLTIGESCRLLHWIQSGVFPALEQMGPGATEKARKFVESATSLDSRGAVAETFRKLESNGVRSHMYSLT
jgi:hypothetical protein